MRQRLLDIGGEADVVTHEARWLIAEHVVDPGNGLHQPVALHRLDPPVWLRQTEPAQSRVAAEQIVDNFHDLFGTVVRQAVVDRFAIPSGGDQPLKAQAGQLL